MTNVPIEYHDVMWMHLETTTLFALSPTYCHTPVEAQPPQVVATGGENTRVHYWVLLPSLVRH